MTVEGACSYREVIKSMCGYDTQFPSEGKSCFLSASPLLVVVERFGFWIFGGVVAVLLLDE